MSKENGDRRLRRLLKLLDDEVTTLEDSSMHVVINYPGAQDIRDGCVRVRNLVVLLKTRLAELNIFEEL